MIYDYGFLKKTSYMEQSPVRENLPSWVSHDCGFIRDVTYDDGASADDRPLSNFQALNGTGVDTKFDTLTYFIVSTNVYTG